MQSYGEKIELPVQMVRSCHGWRCGKDTLQEVELAWVVQLLSGEETVSQNIEKPVDILFYWLGSKTSRCIAGHMTPAHTIACVFSKSIHIRILIPHRNKPQEIIMINIIAIIIYTMLISRKNQLLMFKKKNLKTRLDLSSKELPNFHKQ